MATTTASASEVQNVHHDKISGIHVPYGPSIGGVDWTHEDQVVALIDSNLARDPANNGQDSMRISWGSTPIKRNWLTRA